MKLRTLAQQLLFNTVQVKIQDANGTELGSGTSFVLSHEDELFLVTNKHVIEGAEVGLLTFTGTNISDEGPKIGSPFNLHLDGFENMWHGHPSPQADVAVMPLSIQLDRIVKGGEKAYLMKVTDGIIATTADFETMDVCRPVLFIGYPNGMYDEKHLTPIIRQGTTATPICFDFNGDPVFLIDASVFPGSSGALYSRMSARGKVILYR